MPPRQDAKLASAPARKTLLCDDVDPYDVNELQHVMGQFSKLTWDKQVTALSRISATAMSPATRALILTNLKNIIPLYTSSISSLRSQVASAGLQAFKPFVSALGSRIDSELPNIIPLLLTKLAENSKAFLADDAADVLDTLASVCAPRRLVPLLSQCRDNKSASRQSAIGWLLYRILLVHGGPLTRHLPQPLTLRSYSNACITLSRQSRDGGSTPGAPETPREPRMAPSSASSVASRTPARMRPQPATPRAGSLSSPASGLNSGRDISSWQQRHQCLAQVMGLLVALAEDKAADARLWAARSLLCLHALVDTKSAADSIAPLTQEEEEHSPTPLEVIMCAGLTDSMATGQIDVSVLTGPGLASGTMRGGSGLASARGSLANGIASGKGSFSRNSAAPRSSASAPGLRSSNSVPPLDGTLNTISNAAGMLRLLTSRDWSEELQNVCSEIPGWEDLVNTIAMQTSSVPDEPMQNPTPSVTPSMSRSMRGQSGAPTRERPPRGSSVVDAVVGLIDANAGNTGTPNVSRVRSLNGGSAPPQRINTSVSDSGHPPTRASYGGRSMSLQPGYDTDDDDAGGYIDSDGDREGDGLPNSYMARYRLSLASGTNTGANTARARSPEQSPAQSPDAGVTFTIDHPPQLQMSPSVTSSFYADSQPRPLPFSSSSANQTPVTTPRTSTRPLLGSAASVSSGQIALPLGLGQSRAPVRPTLNPPTSSAAPLSPRSSLSLQQAALRHEQQRSSAASHSTTHTHTPVLSPAHAHAFSPAHAFPSMHHAKTSPSHISGHGPADAQVDGLEPARTPTPLGTASDLSRPRSPDSASGFKPEVTISISPFRNPRMLPRPALSEGGDGAVASAGPLPPMYHASSMPIAGSSLSLPASATSTSHTQPPTPTSTSGAFYPNGMGENTAPHPPVTPRNERMRFLRFRSPRVATPRGSTTDASSDITPAADATTPAATTASTTVPVMAPNQGTTQQTAVSQLPLPRIGSPATAPVGALSGAPSTNAPTVVLASGPLLGPKPSPKSQTHGGFFPGPENGEGNTSGQPMPTPRDGTISTRLKLLRQRPGTGPNEQAKPNSDAAGTESVGKKTSVPVLDLKKVPDQ